MPKIIRVDDKDSYNEQDGIIQWAWEDQGGCLEMVQTWIYPNIIEIVNSHAHATQIFSKDIPNLVKALVMAYKHVEGKDIVL